MKLIRKIIISILFIFIVIISFSCEGIFDKDYIAYKNNQLRKVELTTSYNYSSYDVTSNDYKEFVRKLNAFSANFVSKYYDKLNNDDNENMIVSPLSLYMALAMAVECGNEVNRNELLKALDMTYEDVLNYTKTLYAMSSKEIKDDINRLSSKEVVTNSLWMDSSYTFNDNTLDRLANSYFCNPFNVSFINENTKTNKMIKSFITDKTNGLINQDFEFDTSTMFLILNTLYVKDIWNPYGDELKYTESKYDFHNLDGTIKNTSLLSGYYFSGQVYSCNEYQMFYTQTENGYKIKFIVPNEDFSLQSIFTNTRINYVNSITNFNEFDQDKNIQYLTRCLFPEFSVECNAKLKMVLNEMGICDMFNSINCFSNIVDEPAFCSDVIQLCKLNVNRKGIEGASATYIPGCGAAGPIETVYNDFVVDKSFMFILTDSYNIPLFVGNIKNI